MKGFEMHEGKCKWWNRERGFGFIQREGEPDVWCHATRVMGVDQPFLTEGEPVTFEIIVDPSGRLSARNVQRVNRLARLRA
jgi:cold shock protein